MVGRLYPRSRDLSLSDRGVAGQWIEWGRVGTAWESVADLEIGPLQDLLSLGLGARMNVPGWPEVSWGWGRPGAS